MSRFDGTAAQQVGLKGRHCASKTLKATSRIGPASSSRSDRSEAQERRRRLTTPGPMWAAHENLASQRPRTVDSVKPRLAQVDPLAYSGHPNRKRLIVSP